MILTDLFWYTDNNVIMQAIDWKFDVHCKMGFGSQYNMSIIVSLIALR